MRQDGGTYTDDMALAICEFSEGVGFWVFILALCFISYSFVSYIIIITNIPLKIIKGEKTILAVRIHNH